MFYSYSSSSKNFDHEILSSEEESKLGRIIRDNCKDSKEHIEASHKLTTHNLRLLAKEAYNFAKVSNHHIDDLIGEGYFGLVHAVSKYDPDQGKNARFATYASYWIQQKIRLYIARNAPIHIPNYILGDAVKYKALINENHDMKFSDKEIIEKTGINPEHLDYVKLANVQSISLSHVIQGESTTNEITIEETLKEENTPCPDEKAIMNDDSNMISQVISELDAMDWDIIKSQILDENKEKLQSIGDRYGLSAERIRQLKKKILSDIEVKLRDIGYCDDNDSITCGTDDSASNVEDFENISSPA